VSNLWGWIVIDDPPYKCWDPWPAIKPNYDTDIYPDETGIIGYPEYDTIGPVIPRRRLTCDYSTALNEIVKSDPIFLSKWLRWGNITGGNFDNRNQLNARVQEWISRCGRGEQ
jgi:hypothetical protein